MTGRAVKHKMNRPQRLVSLVTAVAVLLAVGGYLFYRFGPPSSASPRLSTTPECLQRNHAFCTGVALAQVNYKTVTAFTSDSGIKPSLVGPMLRR